MLPELWPAVLDHLQNDGPASVRLVTAVASLYRAKKSDREFWKRAELMVRHWARYMAFRSLNSHLGLQRRVMSWVFYCDSRCNVCGCNLFGQCTGTFPLRVKLCRSCCVSHLISERELCHTVNVGTLQYIRFTFKYCYIAMSDNKTFGKHFLRHEVTALVNSS